MTMIKKLLFAAVLAPVVLFAEDIKITHGPYVHAIDENSATIVWTTNKPALSWAEIAPDDGSHFYQQEREKIFESPLGKKRISKLHRIKVENLKPATTYNYRVFSTEVTKQVGTLAFYGNTASTRVYKKDPPKLKTADFAKEKIKFSVVNDIHEDNPRLASLMTQIPEDSDFMALNGDMVTEMVSEDQVMKGFVDTIVKNTNLPLYFIRGNHESRGMFSEEFMNYFPTPTGKPYYTFKYGPVFFIVLDSGEDKPDSDIEYYGRADFDKYRTEQAKWLQEVVKTEDFKNAAVKILITHIPPAWGDWHGSIDFRRKFAPILNGTGIDLILSGHLHRYELYPANTNGFDATNIVNSNMEMMNITVDKNEIKVDFIITDGKKTSEARPSHVYKVKSSK